VLRGGPAASAGMEPGDLVVAINGNAVTDRHNVFGQIAQIEPGAPAAVRVVRAGREIELRLKAGERPAPAGAR
jgi:serine protease DegS